MSLFEAWREGMDSGAAEARAEAAPAPHAAAPAEPANAADSEPAAEPEPRRASAARRPAPLDDVLAAAVDVARAALLEVAEPEHVGAYQGAVSEGQRLVTHSFDCTDPAYRGWHWVAVLARAPRSKKATVCETALLPGPEALVSPEWLPWAERVRPGDVGPKDTLPKLDADPNLQPGYQQVAVEPDDDVDQIANYEFGLGRERVLSREGIGAAASRWAASEAGPRGEFARQAVQTCGSCGYLLPIAGAMRTQFGVCANEWSPFDGRVVSLDTGCGAHSETDVERPDAAPAVPVVDDAAEGFEMVPVAAGSPAEGAGA